MHGNHLYIVLIGTFTMSDHMQISSKEKNQESKSIRVQEQAQRLEIQPGKSRSLLNVIGYILLVLIPGLLGYLNLLEKHADIKIEFTLHYVFFGFIFLILFFGFVTVLGKTTNKLVGLLLTLNAMLMCSVTWLLSNPDFVVFGEKTISANLKQAVTKVTGLTINEPSYNHSSAGLNFNLRCEKFVNEARCNLTIKNTTDEIVHISELDKTRYTSAGANTVKSFLINGQTWRKSQDNLVIKSKGSRSFPVLIIYEKDDVPLNDLTLFFEITKNNQKIPKFALPK